MCLILFAHRVHPKYHLILAGNRDEFVDRESVEMSWWDKGEDILAGRDLVAGGTWLGVHRSGKWAAVTNYRGQQSNPLDPKSRGDLTRSFLQGNMTAEDFLAGLKKESKSYRGFNLLLGTPEKLYYFSNRAAITNPFEVLQPGVYGLCNDLLDTPWPKVVLGKRELMALVERPQPIEHENVFELLADRQRAEDAELPSTGIGIEKERLLSSMFIESENYGTRCSTSLLIEQNGKVRIAEKAFPSQKVVDFQFQSRAM